MKLLLENLPPSLRDQRETLACCLEVMNRVTQVPGEIRTHSVVVGNAYRGAPAEDCEYLLYRLCEWLNGADFSISAWV